MHMHNLGAKSRAMRKELRQSKREIQMEYHRMIHENVRRFPCRFENCNFASKTSGNRKKHKIWKYGAGKRTLRETVIE